MNIMETNCGNEFFDFSITSYKKILRPTYFFNALQSQNNKNDRKKKNQQIAFQILRKKILILQK